VQEKRHAFYETICDLACVFFHQAYAFSGVPGQSLPKLDEPLESEKLAVLLRSHLRRAMRIPQMEDILFEEQAAMWSAQARVVLPSRSPRIDSTAVWAPVLGWMLLQVLAEWIEAQVISVQTNSAGPDSAETDSRANKPSAEAVNRRAIALFDQLRLRSAFGEAFAFIGVEGEDAWRAAGRIRAAFVEADPGIQSSDPDRTSPWWSDADVRWLTGLHEAKDGWYFNRESYEQMVWWSSLPELVKVDPDATAEKARLRKLAGKIERYLFAAENAGYRLGKARESQHDTSLVRTTIDSDDLEKAVTEVNDQEEAATKSVSPQSLPPGLAEAEGEVLILGNAGTDASKN
jgi:hypothetical protein